MTDGGLSSPTQVWFRNPKLYIKECHEARVENIAWDRGFIAKWRIDPIRFMDLYYGTTPWRCLLVGEQGTTDFSSNGSTIAKPDGFYPTWEFGDSLDDLVKMLEHPAGDDPDRWWKPGEPPEYRPVPGQEHRVVVTSLPHASLGPTKRFLRELSEIQIDYPESIIHLHGMYSYAVMFGLNFRSVDIDARTCAAQGKVYMPHGKEVSVDRAAEQPKWVSLMGFRPVDLKVPRNRCLFTIQSAAWAAKNYKKNLRLATVGPEFVDPNSELELPHEDGRIMFRSVRPKDTDRWLCDTCSIQLHCKFFREGAVCAVPDSEPVELARFFHTRDSDTIIDGLGTLLAAQTRRLNRALLEEATVQEDGSLPPLDPEVTKVINSLFDRGVKLAKLVNPALAAASSPRINVKLQQNTANITAGSPAQLMAEVVDAFARKGIPRESITPEMIENFFADNGQQALDVGTAYTADPDVVEAQVID